METGLPRCNKVHGNPCHFCRISALETATIFFNEFVWFEWSLVERRKLILKAKRGMGKYNGRKTS